MSAIAFLYSCRFSFPRGGWERGCKDHLFLLPLSPSCETLTLWLTRTPVTLITRLFVFEIDTGYENVSNPRFFLVSWNFRSDKRRMYVQSCCLLARWLLRDKGNYIQRERVLLVLANVRSWSDSVLGIIIITYILDYYHLSFRSICI